MSHYLSFRRCLLLCCIPEDEDAVVCGKAFYGEIKHAFMLYCLVSHYYTFNIFFIKGKVDWTTF